MINAGDLTERITLQRLIVARGSDGSETTTPTDFITVWAQYITTGGREFYAAQKVNTEVAALFKIRYRSGMDTRWRIKWGNRYFNILFLNDNRREGEILIACKEVV